MLQIGVLALQGGYDPHLRTLANLGVQSQKVTSLEEITALDGLIIPGGESTTIGKLLVLRELLEPLQKLILEGLPVFGTCAGLILLSQKVQGREQPLLQVLDASVERNAYGRQVESFETLIPWTQGDPVPGIFIRAPQITQLGNQVEVLAKYEDFPVLVRQKNILACSFHPELTKSLAIHEYFLSMIN